MFKTLSKIFKNKNNEKQASKNRLLTSNNSIIKTLFSIDATKYVKQLSDQEIDIMLSDLTLSQVIENRKASTEKKELQIITSKDELKDIVENIFNTDVVSQILDTHIFGFNVFELNYKKHNNFVVPILVQRDYRDFILSDGILFYDYAGGIEIDKNKAIHLLYRPRFNKPYGDALLNKIYFPIKIKNASMQFWVSFLEKFGSPWAIGKTDQDPDSLADEIHAMLNGDTAVIDVDDEISLVQPNSTSKDSFEAIVNYCDKQIRNVVLGANLSSDVQTGSLAASKTHNEVREEIALADAKILLSCISQVIDIFKEINNIKDELWVKLYSEDDPKLELSNRDVNIFNMGYKPTKTYIEETYNIQVEEQGALYKNKLNGYLKPFKTLLKDDVNQEVDRFLKDEDIEDEILKTVETIFKNSSSYEEAQMAILEQYSDINIEKLENILKKATTNATLLGSYNADRV